MKIINPGPEDFHSHSFTFSDGCNTVDEIVVHAEKVGLTALAITDHSQAAVIIGGYGKKTVRSIIHRWRNVHNDVNIIFGIEGDILNEDGDVCMDIQGIKSDFVVLSAHKVVYRDNPQTITHAYINAIEKHHEKIKLLGHPSSIEFAGIVDMDEIIKAANDYGVPMEFNCANFNSGMAHPENLQKMLEKANQIYVNSDAHTLWELQEGRKLGLKYLREQGFLPKRL